ncbi:excinuclease ABC subunit B [Cutibacterium acnes JCM 18918]|nr:excinuclease ABC subunit B [Cutibacterium acnes JCM 18918]
MRPVTDITRRVAPFHVVSEFQPSGDQPQAIAELEKRVNSGEQDVVLLGATGTGKTATVAWLAERLQRPMLVMQPNKTLAAQFAQELRTSSLTMPSSTSSLTTITTNLRRTSHRRIPTSRKIPASTRKLKGCATPRRTPCSPVATSSWCQPFQLSMAWARHRNT